MAHPLKDQAGNSSTEKFRRLTRDYGAANPSMNKAAPVNRLKQEGPESSVGFGADASAPKARGDRPARKTTAANPVATYARGGRVARKGTHINIMIAPQQPQQPPQTPPVNPEALAAMGATPPAVPPQGPKPSPMGMGPMVAAAPGAIPPGLGAATPPMPMRKRGGAVVHKDKEQDERLIHKVLKQEGLEAAKRKYGGAIGLKAGAGSGEGRIEKSDARAKRKSGDRSAEV